MSNSWALICPPTLTYYTHNFFRGIVVWIVQIVTDLQVGVGVVWGVVSPGLHSNSSVNLSPCLCLCLILVLKPGAVCCESTHHDTTNRKAERHQERMSERVRAMRRDVDFWSCFFPLSFNVSHAFPINSSVFQRSAVWSYSLLCFFFYLQHRKCVCFW